MQAFCPNLNNKNIKAEFEELKEALGEDLAYLAWHKSEGEGLGNHPGQADSEAFKAVLDSKLGNRTEAIKQAARDLIISKITASTNDNAQIAYDIADLIDNERKVYVDNVVNNYIKSNSDASPEQINSIKNKARIEYNKQSIQRIAPDNRIPSDVKDIIKTALLYEDLHNAEGIQPILDRANGVYDSSKHLTEKDKDIFRQIKQGTKTRLRSQFSRTIKKTRLIDEIKNQLSMINSKDEDSVDDVFYVIEDFLQRAEFEISRTTTFVKSELGDDLSKWNPQQINYIRQDLIGYYEGLLKSIKGLFNGDSAIARANEIRREDPVAMDLEHEVNQLYNDIVNLQEDYQSTVVMPYAEKVLVDFVNNSDVIENKDQFIKNMKTWLYQDTAYGDLAAGEVVIGMASRSRSPIVRIIEKMMSDTEFERNRRVLKKGKELIKLYNEIRPVGSQISFSNFQKMFMELDGEDGTTGQPTSYFVRDRNYGRFYKEKDEFEQKLRQKYANKGVTFTINEYSGLVETHFPEEDHTADNSIYNQYYDELDEWLDKHCERRYTLEYYKKKRRFLSPEALEAQSMIQHQIDILCQKAMTDDGWVDTNKLDPHERQKLKSLRKEKKDLACPYIFRNNTDNIVVLERKVGKEAEIAEQIGKWNKYIEKHIKYKPNKEKFEAALSKYPKDSIEYRRFLADNYILRINPEIFDAMRHWWTGMFTSYGEEYESLQNRHRAILSHLKEVEGYGEPNLNKLGTGLNQDSSVWRELQYLEQEMANIRKEYEAEHGKKVHANNEENEEVPQFIISKSILSEDGSQTLYDYIRTLYINHPGLQHKNLEEFAKLFTYTDHKGTLRVLKAFSVVTPVADTFKINPLDETEEEKPSFIKTYSSQFSELDESSDFVNSNWKKELKASLQPKIRKPGTHRHQGVIDYTNDQYNKIMSNEKYKKFYDAIMSTMDEANSMIPTRATERSYLMPQITARGMQMLGRSRSILDLQSGIGYMFQDVFTAKFAEKDGDVSTNWDLPRRPDGTVVNNIPIRFIKRLENPALVSSDVIGSVMLYYDMATNYSLKSENLPALELMKEAINPERSTGAHKLNRQYDKVRNMLDFRYYGKEDTIGDDTSKAPSELNKKLTTFGKKFRSLASMSMLAVNFTTIEVGYIDALMSSIADAVGEKYFTKGDLLYGYGLALKHLPYIIANIGNPANADWMISAMQYNQLSRSNSEIFDRTDQSRFRKALNQVRMGGYTMADYLINTMILGATYHHYRLVQLPDGKSQKFMSRSDAIREYTKLGYTEKQAIKKWNSSITTLEQAYYVKDGIFTVKPEYQKYVNKKLENQIAGRLRDRTAVYNGVIPTVEKAKVQQNVWGSYLTLMRNFYVNTYWERAQTGYDTASNEEILSSKLGMRTADSGGYVNFETGETGNGLWWSFLKGMYKYISNVKHLIDGKDMRQLTTDQRYAVKRILTEVIMIAGAAKLMLLSIAFARANDDDDKTPTWTINLFDPEDEDRSFLQYDSRNHDKKFLNWLRWKLALLSTRTFTERSTFYWPGTVTELLTSPSTAKAYLDDLGYNLELFMDLFEINGHDRNEAIKTGGYRGMTRGTRDILKITGFTGVDNLVRGWHTSGIKSTLNWYGNVSPNNFLVPSKSAWLEEQGLTRKGKKKNNSDKKSYAY